MLVKQYSYNLNDSADLAIDIHHNHAHVALQVWDGAEEDWFAVSAYAYGWEHPGELLAIALNLAGKHTPHLVSALQGLYAHPDFEEPEND